ncbi:MAG: response regulator [Candidatus Aenigmatarchaeota archaeon]
MEKRKVLVVEDEIDILEIMKKMLEMKNCLVFTATDAKSAWDIFLKEKPCAVSIDLLLAPSEFDGLELLRRIREVNKEVLCILVTRIDEKEKLDEAKKLNVQEIFIKPLDVSGLEKMVEKLAYGN